MTLTPQAFIDKWAKSQLREQAAAQPHFEDVCRLVGHKTPTEVDPDGTFFTYEYHVEKAGGGRGRADVWYQGHFAWEYKGKHRNLDAAYRQILDYKDSLGNPPLLVVSDFEEFRIYPQFPNLTGVIKFSNEQITQRKVQDYLLWLFTDPDKFRQELQEQRTQEITYQLALKFARLARLMRDFGAGWSPMQIARFLTKVIFVLFVEDVRLLPMVGNFSSFRYLLEQVEPQFFSAELKRLFAAMNGEEATFFGKRVPFFNGGIFADSIEGSGDGTEVLDVFQVPEALVILREVSAADWRNVNPSIIGTLFEGALDEKKKAQLGVHYTSEFDILRVVRPVVMQPLLRLWEHLKGRCDQFAWTPYRNGSPRERAEAANWLTGWRRHMLEALRDTTVLDPACGSGNFLYVTLKELKTLEGEVKHYFRELNLPFEDVVTPRQLYGIEKDPFAAKLAHIVCWIGYLKWRYEDEGSLTPAYDQSQREPHMLPIPIIQDKNRKDEPDHILNDDAILRYDEAGKPYEPEWVSTTAIVGNPPFLGGKKLRSELGDKYLDQLYDLYDDRLPQEADLVCYWFEKARAQIKNGAVKRVGLLATNSIRGGANRKVLGRIKETGDIFMAWGDEDWTLEGAAVRISIVGFDGGEEQEKILDGHEVITINADLTTEVDLTKARILPENANLGFMGVTPTGRFVVDGKIARQMIDLNNANGRVLKQFLNGMDVTRFASDTWIVDFTGMSLEEATKYELPMQHLIENVKPFRDAHKTAKLRENWWLYEAPRPVMLRALAPLKRYIVTPTVAKHRLFVWLSKEILPDHQLIAIAREDDYFFGVLHSYIHEIWSLRMGTWLGKGNDPRYTPTSTFETFPFPFPPGQEPSNDARVLAVAAAAKALHEERHAWLNPDTALFEGRDMAKRLRAYTLTNLYNALEDYRNPPENGKRKNSDDPAAAFAPRLATLHDALDAAVLAAYGWGDLAGQLRTVAGDEELLRRLLALNGERAG